MMYDDDNILSISGIQHFVFCRRQWALIHIEQQWAENLLTVSGEIMHEKAHDDTFTETRNGIITSRGMQVSSYELGIYGVCDIVEFVPSDDGAILFGKEGKYSVVPVEYKHGEPPSARKVWICGAAKNEVLNFIFSQPPFFLKLSTWYVDNQMHCFRARIIEHYYKSKPLKPVTGMRKKPQNRLGVSVLCRGIFLLSIITVCSKLRKKSL